MKHYYTVEELLKMSSINVELIEEELQERVSNHRLDKFKNIAKIIWLQELENDLKKKGLLSE